MTTLHARQEERYLPKAGGPNHTPSSIYVYMRRPADGSMVPPKGGNLPKTKVAKVASKADQRHGPKTRVRSGPGPRLPQDNLGELWVN